MKLKNPSIQIGAVNIKDDFEQAKGLERMQKALNMETVEERKKRLSMMPTIAGFPNPNYVKKTI